MSKTIHMMGICGTAMGSLAGLLQSMGHKVRGSDQNVYPPMSTRLEKLGIKLMNGFDPKNLDPRPDLVIVGNVMTRNHTEVQALLQTNIPYMSLPQAMSEFVIGERHSVVVAGTHGKTTTTALAAWTLEQGGLQPGYMIGGVPLNFENTFAMGSGEYFVIEGDEYDTAFFDKVPKFIHYKPRSVILTSIEFDHADIYKDLDDVKKAFIRLMELTPVDGLLVYNGDDENIRSILPQTKCLNLQSYGVKNADWCLGAIRWGTEVSEFDVVYKGKKHGVLPSTLFGEYNLLNSLAVYVTATSLGMSAEGVARAFKSFKGVKRRQEIIGTPGGVTVIDDFAHHPTAVRVTLDGVKKRFAGRKIFAVFEPRSATSRRKIFQHDFAKSLLDASLVIVSTPHNSAALDASQRFDSSELIAEIKALKPGLQAFVGDGPDHIVDLLKTHARAGDVILLMSNGGFGGIYEKLLKALV